jgi:hypothetical protein
MTVESMSTSNDVSTTAAKLDNMSVSSGPVDEGELELSLPNSFETDVAQEELAEEPRNIILGMLSQVTKGMDLHRITFPTFVLEPRSMLERITDFMSHPQLLLP